MDPNDYTTAWLVYLGAALLLSWLSWRVLKKHLWRGLAYLLECWLLAILLTPWYVLPDQEIMAPAFIVFAMDTITIGPTAGIRALIPLVMALMLMLIVAVVLGVAYRIRRRRR